MVLADWINKKYSETAWLKNVGKTYASAKPYQHIQLKQWLRKEKLKELSEALIAQDFQRKESDLFSFSQTENIEFIEEPIIKEFYELITSREFKEWLDHITGELIYYGKVDGFGASYAAGDHLLCHDDKLSKRKIAYILYLNTLKAGQGGRLILYTNKKSHPDKKAKAYVPEANTLMLFTVSEKSWHEVEEVTGNTSRLSIGGWFHD